MRNTYLASALLTVALLMAACSAEGDTEDDERPSAPAADQQTPLLQQLDELTVAPEDRTGYDRDLFPHWSSQGDGCDTRDLVLQRDGENISVGEDCAVSGSWYSPYDGARWNDPADVDVDHVVPLAESWDSGASTWSTDEREAFANDLDRPQLIAVTDEVNWEKSDQDPAEWLPPVEDYHCAYVADWITVKTHYELAVDEEEKALLEEVLTGC
jgi:hypothetical protein